MSKVTRAPARKPSPRTIEFASATDGHRVIYHEPICAECGSFDIDKAEIPTGDGITELALVCEACGRRGRSPASWTGPLRPRRGEPWPGPRPSTARSASSTCSTSISLTGMPATTSAGPKTSLTRLERHATGHGARLVAVIWDAGIGFTAVRICEGTRTTERAIKNAGGAVRYCPACTPRPRNGRWSPLTSEFIPRAYPNPLKAVTHA